MDVKKSINTLVNQVFSNQDLNCPEIEWIGDDLIHCPGIGEWKCKLQKYTYGDLLYGTGSENIDYKPCNCSNYQNCEIYKNQRK